MKTELSVLTAKIIFEIYILQFYKLHHFYMVSNWSLLIHVLMSKAFSFLHCCEMQNSSKIT